MQEESLKTNDVRYNGFCNFCSQINESNIFNFRSNNYFRNIVETVSSKFGLDYYNNINNNYKNYISDINWNKIELLGNFSILSRNVIRSISSIKLY